MFSLIKDKYVQLNAQFVLPAIDESNTIDDVSTFVGDLGLLLRCPISGKSMAVKVSAQDHSIQIGDETKIAISVPVKVSIARDFNVSASLSAKVNETTKDETAWLYLNTEFGFGMKIRFYKKHLDMIITKSDGLTSEADGLMGNFTNYMLHKKYHVLFFIFQGQFMGKDIKIDSGYNMMKIGDHKPISVVKGPAWLFLGIDDDCWYGKSTSNQGDGVIEGNIMDYMVEELLPSF